MRAFFRLHLLLCGLLTLLAYLAEGTLVQADLIAALIGASLLAPPLFLPIALWRLVFRKRPGTGLDRVLWTWQTGDKFTIEDMCRSFLIMGGIGSGKTSSSGKRVARALLACGAGIIVFASKPEDRAMWHGLVSEAGRLANWVVIGPDTDRKINLLDEEVKAGVDTSGIVDKLIDVSKITVRSKEGGDGAQFWEFSQFSLLYFCIGPLRLAMPTLKVADIRRMIATAPRSVACIRKMDGYEQVYVDYHRSFHYLVMATASEKKKVHPAEASAGLKEGGHADSNWSCVNGLQIGRSACPPACCITPSASAATNTPAPTIRAAR